VLKKIYKVYRLHGQHAPHILVYRTSHSLNKMRDDDDVIVGYGEIGKKIFGLKK